jgi:uncharacterized membrane protein
MEVRKVFPIPCLAGLAASLAALSPWFLGETVPVCGGCAAAAASPLGRAAGVPLAVWGVAFWSAMWLLALRPRMAGLRALGAGVGAGISLALVWGMVVLGEWCVVCLVSAAAAAAAAGISCLEEGRARGGEKKDPA